MGVCHLRDVCCASFAITTCGQLVLLVTTPTISFRGKKILHEHGADGERLARRPAQPRRHRRLVAWTRTPRGDKTGVDANRVRD